MDSDHKFTDMVKEFQISSLTELFDSFGESTLYKLPTATKAWCIRRDNDCRTTDSEQYNFSKTVICAGVTRVVLAVCGKNTVTV